MDAERVDGLVFHVIWRDAEVPDAVTEVWMNGVRVDLFSDSRAGEQNKFADGAGVYTKFGIYKWDWAHRDTDVSQRVVYFDELRIADHRGSVKAVSPPV